MKLPYRRGDVIALPLGDGRTTRAQIVDTEHRLVILSVFDSEDKPIAVLRVSDDALVHLRWKLLERGVAPKDVPEAENAYWMPSARAERIAGGRLGVAVPPARNRNVLEVREDAIPVSIVEGMTLSWNQPLSDPALNRIRALVESSSNIGIRLDECACTQARSISSWHFMRLSLAGECERLAPMAHVRELDLFAHVPVQFFPKVKRLRLLGRRHFDAHQLIALPRLEHLELHGLSLERPSRFLNCPALRELRISRVTGLEKARHVALPQLRALALDDIGDLSEIDTLREMTALDQLELRGFWQYELPEMEWLLNMPALKRAEFDIGGRRKNIELYRRANWAYPWPW